MKKVHIKSYGCQMNVYDGQRMADVLGQEGYVETATPDDADLILLNTCHIRERAAHKVYTELGKLRDLKRERKADGRETTLVVAGCVAQAEGAEIQRRQPAVDLVIGPQTYHRLPELLAQAKSRRVVDTELPPEDKFGHLPAPKPAAIVARGISAFVTVQEGCDKFCTYCVVPYTRGAEISRPFAAIVDEAKALADAGAREITLLGQNVNAWTDDRRGLHDLVEAIATIPAIVRIRYTTSHPNDMTDGLIAAHRDIEKLMPYLHLPVQSGSDRVLKAMNRSHTTASYLRILDRVRAVRPDIALSGDFIVGFPGETGAEFEDTLRLVDAVGYAQAYSFKYSPRPGTPAADMSGQIAAEVMDERLQRLQARITAHQTAFNAASVGRQTDILIERTGRRPGQMIGKSPWLQSVHLETGAAIGDIVAVDLLSAGPNSLAGMELVKEAA